MSEKLTQFDYLLNAMEAAGQEDNPAKHGYGDKRKALFAYVRGLEAAVETPIPHSGADETPPVFGRRWKLAEDGFGLQRDDANGNYVHIDDALSVLHQSAPQVREKCWCETCRPIALGEDMRMVLCPVCGNKRCPHANNHRNACTSSNDVGKPGSSWEHVRV